MCTKSPCCSCHHASSPKYDMTSLQLLVILGILRLKGLGLREIDIKILCHLCDCGSFWVDRMSIACRLGCCPSAPQLCLVRLMALLLLLKMELTAVLPKTEKGEGSWPPALEAHSHCLVIRAVSPKTPSTLKPERVRSSCCWHTTSKHAFNVKVATSDHS